MGHLIFLVLHVLALLFGAVFLFVTIPAHLIYAAVASRRPNWDTHLRCPDCKELVRKEANVCKHCGLKLVPQP